MQRCNREGLSFNPEKSTLVPFTTKNNANEIKDSFIRKNSGEISENYN